MIPLVVCFAAFLATALAARRSLETGLLATLAVGYAYGVARANVAGTFGHFIFDFAVIGLFIASFPRAPDAPGSAKPRTLGNWVFFLMAWPLVPLVLSMQDPLVQLVGLRGAVFFLPFLLLGSRLSAASISRLGLGTAVLNLMVVAVAVYQYFFGIESFFPRNAVTDIIYLSGDVAGYTAYRIPSTFPNAHAFAGTMVLSLPLLLMALTDPAGRRWRRALIAVAILASSLGVFMAATRSHAVILILIGVFVLLSSSGRGTRLLGLATGVGLVATIVLTNERLQRVGSLADLDSVGRRLVGSVNDRLVRLAIEYPIGNGLGGGGTSLPYFLQGLVRDPVRMENEYARILLEQGLPGLLLWLGFLTWFFVRATRLYRRSDEIGIRAACVVVMLYFGTAFIGTGLLTSIPGTMLLLLTAGLAARHFPVAHRRAAREPLRWRNPALSVRTR